MDDTAWAIQMSDNDIGPDYFLDALKNARDLGPEGYADEVIGAAAGILIDSQATNPVTNALVLGLQAFGGDMILEMKNGPVTLTFQVKRDAPAE